VLLRILKHIVVWVLLLFGFWFLEGGESLGFQKMEESKVVLELGGALEHAVGLLEILEIVLQDVVLIGA
jgi:hypothetical protein